MMTRCTLALALALLGCGGDLMVEGAARDAGGENAMMSPDAPPGMACENATDCIRGSVQSFVFCCVAHACSTMPMDCTDANVQLIQASNYDHSCEVDSDCVLVAEGNLCNPFAQDCPSAVISKSALPRYQDDVAKTQAGMCSGVSGCISGRPTPCCRQGTCQLGASCFPPGDTLAACAQAGGRCGALNTAPNACGPKGVGPPDACAYPYEMCCL